MSDLAALLIGGDDQRRQTGLRTHRLQAGDFGAKAGNVDGEFLGGFVVHPESVAREGE